MSFARRLSVLLLAGVASAPQMAFAEEAPDQGNAASRHNDTPQDIVVTALSRGRSDVLSGVSVLSAENLAEAKRATIGDTLAHTPGVSSSSFGPSAARPVLRGLQGDRVRLLTDGIGAFDASGTSVDHAVAINTLTAERIEVVRGPSALLYGSGAIGGVVNVIDSRIPTHVPNEPVHAEVDANYGSAAKERNIAGTIDVPLGGGFVAHADGSWLKTDDLETGGYILSKALRAEAAASPDAGIRALADLKGKLPNTASKTWNVAGGLAYIGSGGNIGFSVSHLDNFYGVPIRYSLDPNAEAEAPRISMRQTRLDLRAQVNTGGGFLDKITLRAGYGDYRHDELEQDGSIGTSFYNKGMEGRLEFVQSHHGAWSGAFGVQAVNRDFRVVGDEKFLPPSHTEQEGFFTVQQFDFGKVKAEAGARYELTNAQATADPVIGNPNLSRTFNSFSASAGASVGLVGTWRVGVNLTHTERAPTVEELFANGPHGGTEAFEIGLPNAKLEKSNGAELTLRGQGSRYSLDVSLYYNRFSNFLYQLPTGAIEEDLPVYAMAQNKATLYGFEAQGTLTLAELTNAKIVADAMADYTRATVRDYGPAPLIPPLRVLGGIEYQSDPIDGRIEVEHVWDQHRTAPLETSTPGYTMVNASIAWRPMGKDGAVTLRLMGNNLLDVDARRHASLLKDYAPLAGRDIRVGATFRI
ncbi:TonB-dependent receptor [Flavisphingomonas formosensis]|uniref:TonB-dependent receptor n=1 Tax=Flavisphingomonas formosensis TaxID=861534 RepID=UPI001E5C1071|nr:TonB-dependent receptor [Sphingomonas formosensis]